MPLQRKVISPANALSRLQELCARSEQCSYDLLQKLRKWGIGASDSEKIMTQLRKERFCDDSRYAEAFVTDKLLYNHWGRRKIALAMRAKRIPSDIAAEALEAIDEEEYLKILHALTKAKASRLGPLTDFEERSKLFRFLAARGFESALISQAIKETMALQSQS